MDKKERLNLTVRDDFKRKASRLAAKRRRSISALFEDLIEEEIARAEESPPPPKKSEQQTKVHQRGVHPRGHNHTH